MDTNVYTYMQKRSAFGKQTHFIDSKRVYELLTWPVDAWDEQNKFLKENPHEKRNPNFMTLSNIPEMSENIVNTERVNMDSKKMFHYEGGWPLEVDITEDKSRQGFIKKRLEKTIEGQDIFTEPCRRMCKNVKDIIKMNNQIDMFEEYFEGEVPNHNIEKLSVKTSMLFKDPEKENKRQINRISWHPDGPHKLAGAYCIMRFQKQPPDMSFKSYVWDIKSPNSPCYTIAPPSPIVSLAYNHKQTDEIAFGCYNGRVGYLDVRTQHKVHMSDVEFSHHEPVVDLIWLSSKLNNEFVTCSTDGQVCWWDNRKMNKPIDKLYVCETDQAKGEDGIPHNLIGGTCLEYVPDHGPKYLIGTEKGSIMLATKKPKKNAELNFNLSYGLQIGRHLGPIYSIKRNPLEYKYFLSVGDWSVSVWEEDMKTPIMKTRYHSSYLTDGCWAPQRPGVFFVTRKDGWMDIWDFYYRQNEVAFSHKVSNSALTTIKLNTVTGVSQIGVTHADIGKFAAIGDSNGTITLLELCTSLYKTQSNERETLNDIFQREKRREEHLKSQRQQLDIKRRNAAKEKERLEKEAEAAKTFDLDKQMKEIEDKFETSLKKAAEDLYKVYLGDDDMSKLLTERLTYGKEKKAVKDLDQAQHVTRVKASLPADYEKKANALTVSIPNYIPPVKHSGTSCFVPTAKDTVVASVVRMLDNGKSTTKVVEWKYSSKDAAEKEIASFDAQVAWDAKIQGKQPVQVEEMSYLFRDFRGNFVGFDKSGYIVHIEVDKAAGTFKSAKVIAECHLPSKNGGAAISDDLKQVFYIDKEDASRIWCQSLETGERKAFLGVTDDQVNEICGFLLVNHETLFVSFNNRKVCRYDMHKKEAERSVQLEGVPNFMCTHLNHIAVAGNLVNTTGDTTDTQEILVLDHELRDIARFTLKQFGQVQWMSMRASVSKTPLLIIGSSTKLALFRIGAKSNLERLPIDIDLTQVRGEGISAFAVFKDTLFISDKEGMLIATIKGDLDDPDEMDKLASKLEEQADLIREKEDQQVSERDKKRKEDIAQKEAEEKLRKEQEAAQRKKREEELAKEMNPLNQVVGFTESVLLYHKINGPRFDMFIVEGEYFYTITEEGPLLQINKFLRSDQKLTPQVLYQSKSENSGPITFFEANPRNDVVIFMAGTKMYKCENGKVEVLFESHSKLHRSGDYVIAKETKSGDFFFYNFMTNTMVNEKVDLDFLSIWRHNNILVAVGSDHKLHYIKDGKSEKTTSVEFDTDARIVHSTDVYFYLVGADKNSMGNIETYLNVYDYDLKLVETNRFTFWGTDTFVITNFNFCPSADGKSNYAIISHHGAKAPIILKKMSDTKFTQPKFRNPIIAGISNYNEFQVCGNGIFFGTGRKIFQAGLTEEDLPEEKDVAVKSAKEAGNLVLTVKYKDRVAQLKKGPIQSKEMGQDMVLTKLTGSPENPEILFIARNNKEEETKILRYNFQEQTETTVVKQVDKLNRKGHLVDILVNKELKINGIDNFGFYYSETDNDVMVLTDLMTYSRTSTINLSRSRQLAVNHARTKGYLVSDDSDSVIQVNLFKHNEYVGLPGNLAGTLEVKVTKNDHLFGLKQHVTKQRVEYLLYKYDLETFKMVEEVNMSISQGYHVEAIRLVGDSRVLVVCTRRDAKDASKGSSSDMLFVLFNEHLEREFMTGDVPVGNTYSQPRIVEVMTTLEGLPVVLVSRRGTLYIFAIDGASTLKQVDAITFSEADGADATLDSAYFAGGHLYLIRNKNVLHKINFEGA